MKLLRLSLPIVALGCLQISCGSSPKSSGVDENDATQFTEINAPEYFVIKVSEDADISFRESTVMASDDNMMPDFQVASAYQDLSHSDKALSLGNQTGFSYGRDGSSCYRENYQSCNPIYQQGNHNVSYAYVGAYNQGASTFLSYQRQNLSYFHAPGNIRSYYYPRFIGMPWGAPIGPGPGVYPMPGRYPQNPIHQRPQNGYNLRELRQVVSNLSISQAPRLSTRTRQEASLGRMLFADTRFSANGRVSCQSCHVPSRSYTDGRRVAIGTGVGKLNTPMTVNRYFSRWQFWDGRATHLASQALSPIESPVEHGSSRFKVAMIMYRDPTYRQMYTELFGSFPRGIELIERYNFDAAPLRKRDLPSYINDWCFDTMDENSGSIRYPGGQYDAARDSYFRPNTPDAVARNWNALPEALRQSINQVFYNFGVAIGSFEKGLVALDSPFDRFAQKFLETNNVQASLNENFGQRELQGLQYFYKQGGCISCHYGSNFTDEKFHNISLGPNRGYVFLGRAKGVIDAINDPFSCQGEGRQACEELRRHRNSIYDLGATKTPSLRNVALTAPYMHDGRFNNLSQVLNHYNYLPTPPAVGRRSPKLRPARLPQGALGSLEGFLRSLNSPVRDLNGPEPR